MKNTNAFRAAWLPLVAALVLAGCASSAVVPPSAAVPAQFKEHAGAATPAGTAAAVQADGPWWSVFADPVLDALVERATTDNTSVQQAAARLAEARALARTVDADRSVQVGVGAGHGQGRCDGLTQQWVTAMPAGGQIAEVVLRVDGE